MHSLPVPELFEVLCETFDYQDTALATNTRRSCAELMDRVKHNEIWFGMEQEYTICDREARPLGWPRIGVFLAMVANNKFFWYSKTRTFLIEHAHLAIQICTRIVTGLHQAII